MNILLAPNAMKGSLSASQIAAIMQKSFKRKFPDSSITALPIADGGNGTLECLMNALGGTVYEKEVTGPIPSMKVSARFGMTKENIAIIESAEAIGLHLLSPSPETILQSTSHGVGELINEAVNHHCNEIWIGLGGSATNDGGAGMSKALDVDLSNIKTIILSDVTNPLLGENGATYTFARQKGAKEEQLPLLESILKNFADSVEERTGKSLRTIPGSGAAGGLAFGLLAFCNVEIVSGIDFILNAMDFNSKLHECDFVITSEGTMDEQTLFGKGISGIAKRARQFNKPVHAFVGRVIGNPDELTQRLSLASLMQISPDPMNTIDAMKHAPWLLADAIYQHNFSLSL